MPSMVYQINGQGDWKNVDLNSKLYALKGTKVSFKPDGANSSGEVQKTFDTIGEQSVTVSAGTASMTVTVVVFSLTPVLTFEDDFQGRSANDVGVCEHITLGVEIAPSTLTPANVGGLQWTLPNRGRENDGLLAKSSQNRSAPDDDGVAYYTAPDHTYSGTLKWTATGLLEDSQYHKTVAFSLVIQNGLSAGMKVSRELTVHMPQARMMVIKNKYQHVKDKPSAGFIGNIYLSPMTVSFAKIHWREAGGKAIARATANRNTPGGYFIFDEGKPHHASNLAPGGPDDANKMAVGKGNSSKGCKVLQHDRVWSGYNTSYPNPFTGKAANRRDYTDVVTTVPSEMIWKINWQYCPSDKVGFGGGRWITFQQVEHQATMDAKGKVTISKAGARKTFALADATMAFPAT